MNRQEIEFAMSLAYDRHHGCMEEVLQVVLDNIDYIATSNPYSSRVVIYPSFRKN